MPLSVFIAYRLLLEISDRVRFPVRSRALVGLVVGTCQVID